MAARPKPVHHSFVPHSVKAVAACQTGVASITGWWNSTIISVPIGHMSTVGPWRDVRRHMTVFELRTKRACLAINQTISAASSFKNWYGSTPGPTQSLMLELGVDRSCEARPRTAVRVLPMDASACPRASFSTTRWQIFSRFANEPSLGLLE